MRRGRKRLSWGSLCILSTRLPRMGLQEEPPLQLLFFHEEEGPGCSSIYQSPVSQYPCACCSCCLECSCPSFSPYWIFLFIQLKNNLPQGGHNWPLYLRLSSVTIRPIPPCISFLVLITQELSLTACLFCCLFPPLPCEFLEGRDLVLFAVAPGKPNARSGPHWELQIFVE